MQEWLKRGPGLAPSQCSHRAEASPSPAEARGCGRGSGCHYSPEVKNTAPADLLPYATGEEQTPVPSSPPPLDPAPALCLLLPTEIALPGEIRKEQEALQKSGLIAPCLSPLPSGQALWRPYWYPNSQSPGTGEHKAQSECVPTSFSNCPLRSLQPHELALTQAPHTLRAQSMLLPFFF